MSERMRKPVRPASVKGLAHVPNIWRLAAKSGCCTLYYGMESANERVLNLMDKHVKKSVIENNLREAAKAGKKGSSAR